MYDEQSHQVHLVCKEGDEDGEVPDDPEHHGDTVEDQKTLGGGVAESVYENIKNKELGVHHG